MRKGQQFKIESIEELKEAYEKLSPWMVIESIAIDMFKSGSNFVAHFGEGGIILRNYESSSLETIPNPFKKEKPEPISTAMNNINEAIKAATTLHKVAEMAKERNELREELNALRKEVEELKEKACPISIIDLEGIEKAFEDKYTRKGIIEETIEFFKGLKEEKPKESPDLKGYLQMHRHSKGIELRREDKHLYISITDGINTPSIKLDNDDAIKIVDYLKKHFEI